MLHYARVSAVVKQTLKKTNPVNRVLVSNRTVHLRATAALNMPSSKGEPTDPELREKIKEQVKSEEKGLLGPSLGWLLALPLPFLLLPDLFRS